ncbi:MAG: hypothetical protein ACXWUG_17315 [Polyangiales bacterium]
MKKLALVCLLLSACSSSSSESAPQPSDTGVSSDGSTSETSPDDTGSLVEDSAMEDTGECNALANSAPPITSTSSMATFPSGTGGTIADGTYFMTAETVYGSSAGTMHQETLAIAAGSMQIVKIGVTTPIDRTTWSYTTAGTTLTMTRTCPSAKTQMLGFTADATTLTTYDATTKIAKAYKRQ